MAFLLPDFPEGSPQCNELFPWRSPLPETTAPLAGRKEPMQLVCAKLTPQKRRQRLQEGRCVFYDQKGHYLSSCWIKVQARWSKGEHWWAKYCLLSLECELLQTFYYYVLCTPDVSEKIKGLIDSGADESFVDCKLGNLLKLTVCALTQLLEASAFDWRLFYSFTHRTKPIQIIITQGHSDQLNFHLFHLPLHPLVLGYPWLTKHIPCINVSTGVVIEEGKG